MLRNSAFLTLHEHSSATMSMFYGSGATPTPYESPYSCFIVSSSWIFLVFHILTSYLFPAFPPESLGGWWLLRFTCFFFLVFLSFPHCLCLSTLTRFLIWSLLVVIVGKKLTTASHKNTDKTAKRTTSLHPHLPMFFLWHEIWNWVGVAWIVAKKYSILFAVDYRSLRTIHGQLFVKLLMCPLSLLSALLPSLLSKCARFICFSFCFKVFWDFLNFI